MLPFSPKAAPCGVETMRFLAVAWPSAIGLNSRANGALIDHRGGPGHGPPDCSSEGGYAPLGLPRPTRGRAPAEPWRASGLTWDVSSLQPRVVEEQHVVDPRLPVEPVADPEDVRLLVGLDDGRVLEDDLLRLEVEGAALLGIVGALRVLEDTVERLVLVDGEGGLAVQRVHEQVAVEEPGAAPRRHVG